jgi:hypothetical protein
MSDRTRNAYYVDLAPLVTAILYSDTAAMLLSSANFISFGRAAQFRAQRHHQA